jgi:hypothetical protein
VDDGGVDVRVGLEVEGAQRLLPWEPGCFDTTFGAVPGSVVAFGDQQLGQERPVGHLPRPAASAMSPNWLRIVGNRSIRLAVSMEASAACSVIPPRRGVVMVCQLLLSVGGRSRSSWAVREGNGRVSAGRRAAIDPGRRMPLLTRRVQIREQDRVDHRRERVEFRAPLRIRLPRLRRR